MKVFGIFQEKLLIRTTCIEIRGKKEGEKLKGIRLLFETTIDGFVVSSME